MSSWTRSNALPVERAAGDLERQLEAIFMIADEPLPIVTLATALDAPVPAVRQSIERLVADYDGQRRRPAARLRAARGRRRLAHLRARGAR